MHNIDNLLYDNLSLSMTEIGENRIANDILDELIYAAFYAASSVIAYDIAPDSSDYARAQSNIDLQNENRRLIAEKGELERKLAILIEL